MANEITLNQDNPLVAGGWLDESLLAMLKAMFKNGSVLSWPGDKAKLKVALTSTADWAKSLAKLPMDVDDLLIDQVADLIYKFIDSGKLTPVAPSGPLVVGATIYTKADANSFLSGFKPDQVSAAAREKVLANPKVLESLKKLSKEHQLTVLNSADLLDLLIKWGPVVLKIVMMLITII